jgi:hypothetical protein
LAEGFSNSSFGGVSGWLERGSWTRPDTPLWAE